MPPRSRQEFGDAEDVANHDIGTKPKMSAADTKRLTEKAERDRKVEVCFPHFVIPYRLSRLLRKRLLGCGG
jgi:hypothetical protein